MDDDQGDLGIEEIADVINARIREGMILAEELALLIGMAGSSLFANANNE